jgi:LPXTG-site transpeptidase (sortase) family protein
VKNKFRLLIIPVAIALILSFFPSWQANAQTYDFELTSVSGVWTATNGGGNTVTGIGTNLVSWGRSSGYGKSGLRFDGSSGEEFNEGDYFLLGSLTHLNWPVFLPTASGATLQITLDFAHPDVLPDPSFTFEFDIEETPNSAGDCPAWHTEGALPCDDKITFPQSYGQEMFLIGDKQYTLKIVGFVDSFPNGTQMSEFITHEMENNTVHLVGILSSVLVESPSISIAKKINDQDVSAAPGPELMVGDSVNWQYVVQNTGNVDLTNISVMDDQIGAITCPSDLLSAGDLMSCTASGTVTAGQYLNTATVTGQYPTGTVTDDDSSWYYGVESSIDVEKLVWSGSTWMDADSMTGPYLQNDSDPLFKFIVTNTGEVTLENVNLSDSQINSLHGNQDLTTSCNESDPFGSGESFTCYGELAWAVGQHENLASVSGEYGGNRVTDTDLGHYFGASPSIDVQKYVWNGTGWVDADSVTGPVLFSGSDVDFKFVVTNTGNVDLNNVVLSDNLMSFFTESRVVGSCGSVDELAAGESFTCYGSLPWVEGQHENQASVNADYDSSTYSDTDLGHYFGANPSIDVEKSVWNGSSWEDADSGTGPILDNSSDPIFRFIVTNTGNMELSQVELNDNIITELFSDQGLTTACVEPDPFGSGDSFTCYGRLAWAAGQHENTASANAYNGEGVSDTDLAHYFGASLGIDVEKEVWGGVSWQDADSSPGPTLPDSLDPLFKFTVTNTSNATLYNVQLSDNLISALYTDQGLSVDCVEPDSLAAGASFVCYGELSWEAGQHTNTASVSGELDGLQASDTDQAHYFGGSPSISLSKSADPEVFIAIDDVITYTFIAENTGDFTLYEVTITDPLPGLSAMACNPNQPATLTPGSTMTCTATYAITQDDLDQGYVENTATAEGTDEYQHTVEDDDDFVVEGPKNGASIDLEKTPDPEIYMAVDDEITYTFVATNNGIFTLEHVQITDPLPGLSSLDCTPTLPAVLEPDESVTCTATYKITQDDLNQGSVQNTATATGVGSNEEEVQDQDSAIIEGPKDEASIHLDKSADPTDYAKVGEEIVYSFIVTNNGIYTLYDVTVTDPLFSLNFGPIDELLPGESETYKYTYTITRDDIDAQTIENTATAMGYDPSENPVSDTDDEIVYGPKPPEVDPNPVLPTTGFAPGKITELPLQSVDMAYMEFSSFWLEIPSLGLSMDIVGVPQIDSGWDVSWLGQNAGWLYGTPFPTWPGNSVVTGHVWDAFDQAGPFVNINKLRYGDKIIIHLYGTEYTFEVRSKLSVMPDDLSLIEQEEEFAWLNLMTCRGFNAAVDTYNYRLIVRSILVDME